MSDTSDPGTSNVISNVPEGFKITNNRTFIEKLKYILPNDAEEASRLDLQHYVFREFLHGNFSAPVEDSLRTGIKVLDMGCGSGKWVVEMAETYPNSTFIGTDVADVFPRNGIPSNASFQQADTLDGLPFPDATFDYVFQRFLILALAPVDWTVAVKEMVRVVKPGGWAESFESSPRLEQPPQDMSVWEAMNATTRSRGIDIDYIWKVGNLMTANGLVDITHDYISCPLGWGGRAGELHGENIHRAYQAAEERLAPVLGVSGEEWVERVRKQKESWAENQTWHKAPLFYGRKPLYD